MHVAQILPPGTTEAADCRPPQFGTESTIVNGTTPQLEHLISTQHKVVDSHCVLAGMFWSVGLQAQEHGHQPNTANDDASDDVAIPFKPAQSHEAQALGAQKGEHQNRNDCG